MPLKFKKLSSLDHVKPYETTTQADFVAKPHSFDPNEKWRNRFRKEGLIPDLLFGYDLNKYRENFTTTSDLEYNWLPKCSPEKSKQPSGLLKDYGNLTKYGLKEQKMYDWCGERLDPRATLDTEYKTIFVEHELPTKPAPICKTELKCDIITWKCK